MKSMLMYFRISALSTSLLVTKRSKISYTSCRFQTTHKEENGFFQDELISRVYGGNAAERQTCVWA